MVILTKCSCQSESLLTTLSLIPRFSCSPGTRLLLHCTCYYIICLHTLNHNLIISLPICMQLQNAVMHCDNLTISVKWELVYQQYCRLCSKAKSTHVPKHLHVCAFVSIKIIIEHLFNCTPLLYRKLFTPHLTSYAINLFFFVTHTYHTHKLTILYAFEASPTEE